MEEAFLAMAQELIRIREAKAGATSSGATGAKAGSAEGTVSVSSKNAEKKAAGAKNCC